MDHVRINNINKTTDSCHTARVTRVSRGAQQARGHTSHTVCIHALQAPTPELQRGSSNILEEHSVKSLL